MGLGLQWRPSYKVSSFHSALHSPVGLLALVFSILALGTGISSASTQGKLMHPFIQLLIMLGECSFSSIQDCINAYYLGVIAVAMFGLSVIAVLTRRKRADELDSSDHDVTMYCTESR